MEHISIPCGEEYQTATIPEDVSMCIGEVSHA